MNREKERYSKWLEFPLEDKDLTDELNSIKSDDDAIYDRFYRDLSFGTAGLRGIIGAGTNRMNIYTVRRATNGLAAWLSEKSNPSVAISYDSRIKSDLFAKEAAATLASCGIKVYIVNRLMPTPVLSFCVRQLKCDAGIMITASHNPSVYNGYKAYGSDGCQMNESDSEKVMHCAEKADIFAPRPLSFEDGLKSGIISYIDESVYDIYYGKVKSLSINPDVFSKTDLHIVYTPLCGTGNEPVRRIFKEIGVKKVTVVPEQEKPDGNFTTCPYPNPEIRQALDLGIELCKAENADLLIATDPDADRAGIAVKGTDGELKLMSGNALGVLLLDYIAAQRTKNGTMPKNPVAVKSIVTTAMAERVAENYGIELKNVLTGFKYIGKQIGLLEEKGEQERFVFAYEESYGFLSGSFVRDKDAVIASMLIAEMASYYKLQGKSLLDVYGELEKKYGVYFHAIDSFTFEGASGGEKMTSIMKSLRDNAPSEICSLKVLSVSDYLTSSITACGKVIGKIDLPVSNVLTFNLENNCSLIVRPSGTEPKIKFYYTVVSENRDSAELICKELKAYVKAIID